MKPNLNLFPRAIPRTHHRTLRCLLATAACGLMALTSMQAATNSWIGAGADFNWSTAGNWTNGAPTATSDVFFYTNTMDVPNNIVDANTTIQSLQFQNTNVASPTSLQINPGVTLTISNVSSGYALRAGDAIPIVLQLNSRIDGLGAGLQMVASNAIMSARQSQVTTTGSGSRHTLDMSGLDTFTGYLSRLYVAGDSGNRAAGTLYLAKTNLIMLGYTAGPPLLLGNAAGAAGGALYLGWTNAIFSDNGMHIAYNRGGKCILAFNNAAYGGTAYFRNRAGTGRQSYWRIGDGSAFAYSGNACNGEVDFSLGTVDAMVNELVVGRNMTSGTTASAAVAGAVGILTFNSGTIDANTVIVGYDKVDYGPRVDATINVDGTGKLIVNNSMQLGRFMKATSGNGVTKAILNIGTKTGGGTVVVNGPILSSPSVESDNQSEINIRHADSSLSVRNSVGPLLYLELTAGKMTIDIDGNPTTPVCTASNLLTAAGFNLEVQGGGLEPGRTTLIDYDLIYSGSPVDDIVLSLPPYLQGFLSNNLANTSIDLWITNKLITVWNGDKNDIWDIGTTTNWKDGTTGSAKIYGQSSIPGDIVRFDDSATGSGNVNLVTDIGPMQTLVNNDSKAYTFSGTGRLTGPTGLTKTGPGTLTIANSGANDFEGAVAINGGTLQIGGGPDRLPTDATVMLADASGATLNLNNQNQTLATLNGGGAAGGNVSLGGGTLTITGDSAYAGTINGAGKLVKAGAGTLTLYRASTFSGGTTIETNTAITVVNDTGSPLGSGSVEINSGGTLRIGNGTSAGGIGSSVITNEGTLVLNVTNDVTFANFITGAGSVTKSANNAVTLGSANDYTGVTRINAGVLRVTHPNALGSASTPDSEYSTVIANAAVASLELANDVALDEVIQFATKSGTYLRNPGIRSVSGTNVLNGPLLLTSGGSVHNFSANAGSKLVINGPIVASTNWVNGFPYHALDGDGEGVVNSGFVNGSSYDKMTNNLYKLGNGTWTLAGDNTYIGFTVISNGTLVVNGSLLGTNVVKVNAAGFWVGCIVSADGTLKGDGLIHCVVTNAGTLSAGSSIGTLTISNSLTMLPGSTTLFEIGDGQYDQIKGLSSVSYGGTLKVTLAGTLAGGEVFKLFVADSYPATTFDTFDLPVLANGLSWDKDQLTVDGTLRVAGGGIKVGQIALLPDGNISLSGTSGLGNEGYRILATTNVADSLSWKPVGSGVFSSGAFSFTDLEATNYPQRFYQIVTP